MVTDSQIDESFREYYEERATGAVEPVGTVTGWIWNRRMDDVMFVKDAHQYPNGAIEIVARHHYFDHNGEMDLIEGEYLVRKVYPNRGEALNALLGRIERRIARAQSMRKRLLKKLDEAGPELVGVVV